MRVLIFQQEPDMQVSNYVKQGYVLLEGDFKQEKDIIVAYMKNFGMDTDFWYKLKLIPEELTEELKLFLPNGVNYLYKIDAAKRKLEQVDKRKTYKIVEYKTKQGEIVPIPEDCTILISPDVEYLTLEEV